MSLSRILSRLTSSAVLAAVGISAMFVSVDIPTQVNDFARWNNGITFSVQNTSKVYAADASTSGYNTPGMPDAAKQGAGLSTSSSTPSAADAAKSSIDKWGETVMQFANFAVEVLYMFLIPLTMLAGWLLSPDWTFGDIFGLRAIIHNLWIFISNVVYIVFAFSLVAVAFVNIYSGGGNFAIKKALPRFLVGIIIVPFTWFIVSATLSVSNLLTASVLRLPYEMMNNTQRSYALTIPKTCTLNFKEADAKKEGKTFECGSETHQVLLGDFISSGNGAYNMLSAYAYSIFSIQTLKSITSDIKLQSVLNGGIQLIVGLISFCVFGLLILALCFALFARAFQMWIMAIFSPLFGLFYFFDGKIMGDFQKKIGFKEFLGLAMVPVYVSAALSFGLLFLTMTQNVDLSDRISASSYWDSVKQDKDGNANFALGQAGDKTPFMTIVAKGVPLYANDAAKIAGTGIKLGQNAIGRIIVSVLGLVVLWMAVMAALKGSKVTEAAVSPFEKFGKSIADMAKAIPQHVPIIPTKQWGMSAAGLQNFGQWMAGWISNSSTKWNTEWTSFGRRLMGEKDLSSEQKEMKEDSIAMKNKDNLVDIKNSLEKMVSLTGEWNKNGRLSATDVPIMVDAINNIKNDVAFSDPSKAAEVKKKAIELIERWDHAGWLTVLQKALKPEARMSIAKVDGIVTVPEIQSLQSSSTENNSSASGEPTPIEKLMKDIKPAAVWTTNNGKFDYAGTPYDLTKNGDGWHMKTVDFNKLFTAVHNVDSGITETVLKERLKNDKKIDIIP